MTEHHAHDDAPHACQARCPIGEAVSRRLFMERSAIAALGAMMAACGDGVFGVQPLPFIALPSGTSFQINVGDYPALAAVGGIATVSVQGFPIAVGHTGNGAFAIWSMVCPHQSHQVDPVAGGFKCTGHGATWNPNGVWTGGQSTGNLTLIPSTYDPATNIISVNADAAPAVQQDFTIDLTVHPRLANVGGWEAFTRVIPGTNSVTTRIIVYNTPLHGYVAYGAACGHMGKYLTFNTQLGHWKCDEHHAEFDVYGQKLKDADEHPEVPTAASLVLLEVTNVNATTLRVRGNSPPQGTNFG
ncbi:MAG: Rieske 2Fe-2S domain-containing protein [Gemmatimonadetes bacterium]|nr:Rieske 2Fe-2S domain-containing protein [Gemmatimonadota bacterium]